jgi:hypothetical protein
LYFVFQLFVVVVLSLHWLVSFALIVNLFDCVALFVFAFAFGFGFCM